MEEVTRRGLAGLLGAVAAGMAVSAPAQAATGADSLDALAKAGIPSSDIGLMARKNPALALGLGE